MEQKKETPIDAQISENGNIDDGLNEYRVYEHPLLPKKIVKRGFNWPALLVGPAYLIYRRLWIPVVVWIVAMVLAQYIAFNMSQVCNPNGLNCSTDLDQESTLNMLALIVGLFVLGINTNSLWERDLINRGYSISKSRRARSMDDFLAILESEKKFH